VWESANKVGIAATIISASLAFGAYIFSIEWRLSTLGAQTQAALTSPIPGNNPASDGGAVAPSVATCHALALRVADHEAKTQLVSANAVKDLMSRLGCFK
jgi:hypothetical protein